MDVKQLQQLNEWLLGSGLAIDSINRLRKSVSAIKAGRLATFLGQRSARVLMISDVPDNRAAVIGSGLLVPHHQEELAITEQRLPEWILHLVSRAPPLAHESAFSNIENVILATSRDASLAASDAAASLGLATQLHREVFQGDAEQLGSAFARDVIDGPVGITIWGGESTVRLPEHPGRGGRNQHLALAAALELSGRDDCYLLAAGTDGSDGPTEDAGALVDGATIDRGALEGLDGLRALHGADAGTFLEASGDLVQTGPTGTNVMDLVIGYKERR